MNCEPIHFIVSDAVYSYLRDSIGSNLAALAAGYNPDASPTIRQESTPNPIHNQGIMN